MGRFHFSFPGIASLLTGLIPGASYSLDSLFCLPDGLFLYLLFNDDVGWYLFICPVWSRGWFALLTWHVAAVLHLKTRWCSFAGLGYPAVMALTSLATGLARYGFLAGLALMTWPLLLFQSQGQKACQFGMTFFLPDLECYLNMSGCGLWLVCFRLVFCPVWN
ncbi:hypothetical protein Nepgr_007895 [Nepenthes gracilis]|uniref:Uncharacterized protein n=1 Tax=Nepenthes gracilis TaxID=150966 RepID=A0AAD3S7Q1_NEPGR|nr:hypothetical protein Nepgr_007895 [Nepenthes gracilis]